MLRRFLACMVATLACLAESAAALRAETIISQPDAAYVAGTTLINISGAVNPVNSVSGGGVTVTFTPGGLTPAQAAVFGWNTWSFPPDAETHTPFIVHTGFLGTDNLGLALSGLAIKTFGFELEPNLDFGTPVNVTATFSTGDIINRAVNGSSGARLFALTGPGVITNVSIIAPGSGGLGIGQFRFSTTDISAGAVGSVPEPASLVAWGLIAGVACAATRRRRMSKAA
jgi:hypothetical protein